MKDRLKEDFEGVARAYEKAQSEGGLVSIIKDSTLQQSLRDVILVLFDQVGRTLYPDKGISCGDAFKGESPNILEKIIPNVNFPQYRPLLYHNPLFLYYDTASMQGIIPDGRTYGELTHKLCEFQDEIEGLIGPSLPADLSRNKVNKEVTDFLLEFYSWHARPTLSAARLIAAKKQLSPEAGPTFSADLAKIRPEMQELNGSLLKPKPYNLISMHASNILQMLDLKYIDQHFPQQQSWERTFAVNLYAAAYLFNYVAQDRIDYAHPGVKN